jgi:DNA modification methylase
MPRKSSSPSDQGTLRLPEVLRVRVEDLKPFEGNAREHDAEQVRLLQKSMKQYGLAALPVVQQGTLRILAGHGRVEALKASGHGEVVIPVIAVDLSDKDATAYTIADNRLTDLSTWNIPQLRDQLHELEESGFDLEAAGFTDEAWEALQDLEFLETDDALRKDPDEAPPCPEVPQSVLGDLYILGRHRLLCGDATNPSDVARLMDGQLADMVLTDPPYAVAYESSAKNLKASGKASILNDAMEEKAFEGFLQQVFQNYAKATAKHAAFYIWHPSRYQRAFENAMNAAGILQRSQIVWVKNAASFGFSQYKWKHELCLMGAKEGETPLIYLDAHETAFYAFKKGDSPFWKGDKAQTTVWQVARETGYVHPTQKPIDLLRKALTNSSRPQHVVADFFGGSGSTLMTCEVMGRRCFSMELDPKFVDVIVQRWEEATGKKAQLERLTLEGSAA